MSTTSTVQEILDRARGIYLNDPNARTYPNDKLIPQLKAAYDDLQTEYQENGLSTIDEIAAPVTITAGITTYGTLPTDFVWPVKLEERIAGSTDLYTPMRQLRWEANITPDTQLNYWAYREDTILFPEATTNREVRLYYQKLYPDFPVGTGDPVIDATTNVLGHAIAALAARIAWYVHIFINQNSTLADLCMREWENEKFMVINLYVKAGQSIPARPRPFRTFYRLGNFWP